MQNNRGNNVSRPNIKNYSNFIELAQVGNVNGLRKDMKKYSRNLATMTWKKKIGKMKIVFTEYQIYSTYMGAGTGFAGHLSDVSYELVIYFEDKELASAYANTPVNWIQKRVSPGRR